MADSTKPAKAKSDKKREPRAVFVGLKIEGHPEITKDDIKIVYATRNAVSAMKQMEGGGVINKVLEGIE